MRPVTFGRPTGTSPEERFNWIAGALAEIERASRVETPPTISQSFQADTTDEVRTLTASAALDEIRSVLGTFLNDLRKTGSKRT